MSELTITTHIEFDDYDKYYTYSFYCSNCREHTTFYILKGHKIKYLTFKCPNCECIEKG